ncbi:MAG: HAMP domain-containing histidine kinase, partial [Firmicutes bacterium]|nr:HAMP domain-containing histidine kinase [Bacillota bacterium]
VHGAGEVEELCAAFNRMSEQIEAHDRVRDEFVANASHELKTPLSTMKLLSESILYQEDPDPAMMKEFFKDVNSEVDRLTRIQTELLRLVQDDNREEKLSLETRRLDEIAEPVIRRLQLLAAEKNIKLLSELTPVSCEMDPMRMEQVLVNLIENAIKYTDQGHVKVIIKPWKDQAQFIVEDTGIGIPASALPNLFQRFYRVDKARSRATGGTGLGLAIVESIVRLHNGEIHVESEPGKGSRFVVTLPQHQQN